MECLSPVYVPRKHPGALSQIAVPCGKCMACLSNKRAQWAFRLSQELKDSESAHFVTLTYTDENLPIGGNDTGTLLKKDVQDFLKRLRRNIEVSDAKIYNSANAHKMGLSYERPSGGTSVPLLEKVSEIALKWPKIKYFICGEYGGKTMRPHYHCIFFNLPLYLNVVGILDKSWGLGFVNIGQVNDASINYTAKYCIEEYVAEKENAETFMLVSKGMGIGYVKRMKEYHTKNKIFYGINSGGRKVSMPRYYREKMFTPQEQVENRVRTKFELEKAKEKFRAQQIAQGANPEEVLLMRKIQYSASVKKRSKSNDKL